MDGWMDRWMDGYGVDYLRFAFYPTMLAALACRELSVGGSWLLGGTDRHYEYLAVGLEGGVWCGSSAEREREYVEGEKV